MNERMGTVKCVVWDLDNTIWNGILSEDQSVVLNQDVLEVIRELDLRGILHSIASRNNHDLALKKLQDLEISDFFLYPQIGWHPKSESIKNISKSLNIAIDSLAFVDDQEFEREEVSFTYPSVYCIDALNISEMLAWQEMTPRFITADSAKRRKMYQNDLQRNESEENYSGAKEGFLSSLQMKLSVSKATIDDLQRAEELTVRTNQLNTTGITFSYDELLELLSSEKHLLLIVELDDRFGTYGKIGLVLIEKKSDSWMIKLFLMSCRVMSRGIGNILITLIRKYAEQNKVRLFAEFVETDVNRMMYMTYKFNRFNEISKEHSLITLENDMSEIPAIPNYVNLDINDLDNY